MNTNLTTNYGGLTLNSPLIVGSCPLTADETTRIAIQSAGAGAMVLPSLFEEQVILWNAKYGHALTPRERQVLQSANQRRLPTVCEDAEHYLAMVKQASGNASIPVIASLNGEIAGNWLGFTSELQAYGASGIELLIHHAAPTETDSPREVEDAIVDLVSKIDKVISIPLFLKLEPHYTSLSHLARRLLSGTQGLVLFGREPNVEICLDSFQVKRHWDMTHHGSIGQAIASIMRIHRYCPALPIAACGGIGSSGDVVKALLAGADAAMVTSAIYRDGPDVIRKFLDGLTEFMNSHQMTTMAELYAKRPLEFDSEAERREYIKALSDRPESFEEVCGDHALQGDRWGHPA